MSAGFRVFLDACVLFPQMLRDVLLTAAESDLYFPLWSSDVLDEIERTLIEKRRLTQQQTAHLREEMTRAFPDSTVSGYGPLIASMTNHEHDRHVLAAAIRGHAEIILTENPRHFPIAACDPYGIRPCSVDDFLSDLLSVDHERLCEVLRTIERDRRNLSLAEIVRIVGIVAPQFQRGISFHLGI
jgi:predicted nucleic acid-binding protein